MKQHIKRDLLVGIEPIEGQTELRAKHVFIMLMLYVLQKRESFEDREEFKEIYHDVYKLQNKSLIEKHNRYLVV